VARPSSLVFIAFSFASLAAGCGAPSPAAIHFDPCQPLSVTIEGSATTAEQDGVRAAVDMWNVAAGTRLSVTGDAMTSLPVRFEPDAESLHGLYEPESGRVRINTDLTARPLAVTIAHEIGHAVGLVHVIGRPSLMNPGNLGIGPNEGDVAALEALWGRCAGAPSE
jgi:hypothetical protein